MNIEIIGTESLGVRGLCCFIKTKNRRIFIDPGIALGYTRYKLHPHPLQVAVDERIQKKMVKRWAEATDIVFSHYHGDHVPLSDANPFQFNVKKIKGLNPNIKIWTKSLKHCSPNELKRAKKISSILKNNFIESEGEKHGIISFSNVLPHGDKKNTHTTVMMTKIEDDIVFVHASDIQLLNDEAVLQIIKWKPDIVFTSGPPLYLSNRLSESQINKAWDNAVKLAQNTDTLIIDHHLMRSIKGAEWLNDLSLKTKRKIICGADFMKKPRRMLEALRVKLYNDIPVPDGWNKDYFEGKVKTNKFWNLAKEIYNIDEHEWD